MSGVLPPYRSEEELMDEKAKRDAEKERIKEMKKEKKKKKQKKKAEKNKEEEEEEYFVKLSDLPSDLSYRVTNYKNMVCFFFLLSMF